MSFLKTMINSIARTFGRIIGYAIIGALIALIGSKVFAKELYWVQLLDSNDNQVYTYSNLESFNYLGQNGTFNHIDIHYQLSTQANETVYVNSAYNIQILPNTVKMRYTNAWYKDTNGTWHSVVDYCTYNATITSGFYSKFQENYSCQFKTEVSASEFIVRYQYLYSDLTNANISSYTFTQQSNGFTTNPSEANIINANNDRNTNIIVTNITEIGDTIKNELQDQGYEIIQSNEDIKNAIENQYNVCSIYNIQKNSSTIGDDIEGNLTSTGGVNIESGNRYITSDFYIVNANKTYTLTLSNTLNYRYCLYDKNKTYLSCSTYNNQSVVNITPSQDGFLRFTYDKRYNVVLSGEYCYNALEKENDDREEEKNLLGQIVSGITNLPTNIANAFENLLEYLFVPDDFDFYSEIVTPLETKLGFIATIPIQVITWLINLPNVNYDEFTSITLPSFEVFDYELWSNQVIDLTDIFEALEPYKIYTSLACVVICINTLYRHYHNFANGGGDE